MNGLKLKNKGHMNFYECCDLTEKLCLMYIYRTRRKLEQKVLLLLSFFILQVWDCYIHFNLSQYGFNGNRTLQSIKSCHIYLRDLQRFIHNYFQFRWDITFIYYLEKGKSNHFYFFSISTLVLLIYKSSLGGFSHIFLLGNRI